MEHVEEQKILGDGIGAQATSQASIGRSFPFSYTFLQRLNESGPVHLGYDFRVRLRAELTQQAVRLNFGFPALQNLGDVSMQLGFGQRIYIYDPGSAKFKKLHHEAR